LICGEQKEQIEVLVTELSRLREASVVENRMSTRSAPEPEGVEDIASDLMKLAEENVIIPQVTQQADALLESRCE